MKCRIQIICFWLSCLVFWCHEYVSVYPNDVFGSCFRTLVVIFGFKCFCCCCFSSSSSSSSSSSFFFFFVAGADNMCCMRDLVWWQGLSRRYTLISLWRCSIDIQRAQRQASALTTSGNCYRLYVTVKLRRALHCQHYSTRGLHCASQTDKIHLTSVI